MEDFPETDESQIDLDLERRMSAVQKIVNLARAARTRANLKIRQPLAELRVVLPSEITESELDKLKPVIKDELNVKDVVFSDDPAEVTSLKAKPNFKLLGPKLGKDIGAAKAAIESLSDSELNTFRATGTISLSLNGQEYELGTDEIEIEAVDREGFAAESDSGYTIAIVTQLTDELRAEGYARELVNKIQNMRKSNGFQVTDRITVAISSEAEAVIAAMNSFREYIMTETLADSLEQLSQNDGMEWNINEHKTLIRVTKV